MEIRCPLCNQELPYELQLTNDTPIELIHMSFRLKGTLMNEGIKTIGEARRLDSVRIPNCGAKTRAELQWLIARLNPAVASARCEQPEHETKLPAPKSED